MFVQLKKKILYFKSVLVVVILVTLAVLFLILPQLLKCNRPKSNKGVQLEHPLINDWKKIHQMEYDYWNEIRVETMTPEQIIDYFKWSNRAACEVTHYFGGSIKYWRPTGIDGQYPVCLDKPVRPITSKEQRCIVYSFGINNEWSFDEAMEKYGCDVFAFDPSINKTNHDHSEHIHFYNIGLAPLNYVNDDNWKLMTLDSIYRMLVPHHGETVIDYLKIDIEWSEWSSLKQILQSGMLGIVRQLSVEFHLPNKALSSFDSRMTIDDYRSLVRLVKSIENNKMTRFESRINPWARKRIKNLNRYFGPICFDLSFYQILPRKETRIINTT